VDGEDNGGLYARRLEKIRRREDKCRRTIYGTDDCRNTRVKFSFRFRRVNRYAIFVGNYEIYTRLVFAIEQFKLLLVVGFIIRW